VWNCTCHHPKFQTPEVDRSGETQINCGKGHSGCLCFIVYPWLHFHLRDRTERIADGCLAVARPTGSPIAAMVRKKDVDARAHQRSFLARLHCVQRHPPIRILLAYSAVFLTRSVLSRRQFEQRSQI
jgi:hypothetical protein